MKILLTGCNGQVGYCLAEQLKKMSNVDLLAFDKEQLDIVDAEQVNSVVSEKKPDIIINAAAYTAVDKAESESQLAYSINHIGAKNLAEAATAVDALLIHISTDYVFPGTKEGLYTESDQTGPVSVYGKSKLDGENAIIDSCSKYIIIRTAWVFGEHGHNFVKTMLRLAKTNKHLKVVSDQQGGPTYAGDIAKAIIAIAVKFMKEETITYGLYHYSGLPHVTWSDFAREIFNKAKDKKVLVDVPQVIDIATTDYPTPAQRPKNSKLNTKRITQEFDIQASDWQIALNSITDYKS